ncbi:hypothetical protein JCM8097_001251 [Rhodosporidiobolus ruineniae]
MLKLRAKLSTLAYHLVPSRIFRLFFPYPPSGLASSTQGDTLLGLQKRHEAFLFFSVSDADEFKKKALREHTIHDITTTADVVRFDEEIRYYRDHHPNGWSDHVRGLNVAFTAAGLAKFGVDIDACFDEHAAFRLGQEKDAKENLGDPLLKHLAPSIVLIKRRDGVVRPGSQAGHEHFGFRDACTRPTVIGFNDKSRPPGDVGSPTSTFFVAAPSGKDPHAKEKRWMEDGSFMVLRELQQKVPEFEKWCEDTAQMAEGRQVSPELIAARAVGRWKNGVPLALSPDTDYKPDLVNNFRARENFNFSNDLGQENCPYAAHIRKANPRKGTCPTHVDTESHRILRSGIPYGPEVTSEEAAQNRTIHERGLFFVCYQSSIEQGFQFIQKNWLNDPSFPPGNAAKIDRPGEDLIAGQKAVKSLSASGKEKAASEIEEDDGAAVRTVQGIKPGHPQDPLNTVSAPRFVVPRGGEYFFTPSVPGLKYLGGL